MAKKIWGFQDSQNWGPLLMTAAAARGYDARVFDDYRIPDEGIVFFHMHHHPAVRTTHKRAMAALAVNSRIELIPDYRSSVLFDDKVEQVRYFARWMPATRVFTTPASAKRFVESGAQYPFVSKSAEGTSSHNVRLIETAQQARDEIRAAFSDVGISTKYGQEQRGILLWQDFVPGGSTGDVRIIAIGGKRLMLRRENRADKPMTAGRVTPVTSLTSDLQDALRFANEFFAAEQIAFGGIDVIRDGKGRWTLLELTVGWTLHSYYECAFIENVGDRWIATADKGTRVWDVLLDEIERGAFARVPATRTA